MADFTAAHAFTAKWEGGLSDHPSDPGGVTNYGICIEFLKDFAKTQANRDLLGRMGVSLPVRRETILRLTAEHAAAIMKVAFWMPLQCDQWPQPFSLAIYDTGVNMGLGIARRFAQSAVGTTVDGIWGPKTRAALEALTAASVAAHREAALRVCSLRMDRYDWICERNPRMKVFYTGWSRRVYALEELIKQISPR